MRLLALTLLLGCSLAAQDTTCNSKDYAVVEATNAADKGTAGGAEYNSTSATWGIQAVFDQACSGLRVRIVCDTTNQYGSGSTSWTNRDADKAIDIDTGSISTSDPIFVMGYTNTTTPVTLNNYCDMNFSGGTAGGFVVAKTVDMSGLNIQNASGSAHTVNFSIAGSTFHHNKIEAGGGSGFAAINVGNEDVTVAYNRIERNAGSGLRFDGNASGLLIFRNFFYSSSDGMTSVIWAAGSNQQHVHLIGNIIYGGADGVLHDSPATTFPNVLENTFYSLTDDALELNSSNNRGLIGYNVFADNGGYAIEDDTTACFSALFGNSYHSNTAGTRSATCSNANDYEAGSLDTTAITFVDGAGQDMEVTAGAIGTFTFPGGQTASSTRKGAVHAEGAAGASVMIQGVR